MKMVISVGFKATNITRLVSLQIFPIEENNVYWIDELKGYK